MAVFEVAPFVAVFMATLLLSHIGEAGSECGLGSCENIYALGTATVGGGVSR